MAADVEGVRLRRRGLGQQGMPGKRILEAWWKGKGRGVKGVLGFV